MKKLLKKRSARSKEQQLADLDDLCTELHNMLMLVQKEYDITVQYGNNKYHIVRNSK